MAIREFFGRKGVQVALHAAGILLFIFSPYFFGPGPGRNNPLANLPDFNFRFLANNILVLAFFYVNLLVLLPGLLKTRGWTFYLVTILVCFVGFYTISYVINEVVFPREDLRPRLEFIPKEMRTPPDEFFRTERPFRPRFMFFFPFLMAWALSTSIRFSLDFAKSERERKERENENLKSELALLRSQISPHFMFNVLNSLTALARKKSDDLEPIIIKLSQLMRYMIYDSSVPKVPLETEEEYLQNYIDLQTLRVGPAVKVSYEKEMTSSGFLIEPMLLIPFVENAFKHGIGLIINPVIDVKLICKKEALTFIVKNKFAAQVEEKDATHGIGLQNVKRRLELLYKNKYTLNILREGDWFTVELNLKGE